MATNFKEAYQELIKYLYNNVEDQDIYDNWMSFQLRELTELIEKLGIPEKLTLILIVNGSRISNLDHKLKPDDLVVMFPPIGGGNFQSKGYI